MNMFDETKVDYKMIDNICHVNGEHLVDHIRLAVVSAAQELKEMVESGTMDEVTYALGAAAVQGMVAIGMWIEQGVIDATAEDFRKMLDNPWPEV